MRPDLWQLYSNPQLFIELLTQAGVENAHPKVASLTNMLVEYYSMKRHIDRLEKDRTETHQSEATSWGFKRHGRRHDPKTRVRNNRRISQLDRTIIIGRGFLKRREAQILRKIAKWPEVHLGDRKLETRPRTDFANRIFKKRIRKGKPRTKVLG